MLEREIMQKCVGIFKNLGWDVKTEEFFELGMGGRHNPFVCDIVLRHKGEIYGAVEVISRDDLKERATRTLAALEYVEKVIKPKIFVVTNGFAFDVYHFGEFYGCLTVPPTPDDVDILFGGEEE